MITLKPVNRSIDLIIGDHPWKVKYIDSSSSSLWMVIRKTLGQCKIDMIVDQRV